MGSGYDRFIKIVFGFLVVVTVFYISFFIHQSVIRQHDYRDAVEYISRNSYAEAENLLQNLPRTYKDRDVLYAYTSAKLSEGIIERNSLMQQIPDNYQGVYYEEIVEYKTTVSKEYETARLESLKMERQKKAEEEERKKKLYSGTYPSYGMREDVLKYCALGTPEIELCRDFYSLVPRAKYKEYIFGEAGKPLSGKITIRFRWHNSSRSDDYIEFPSDNGYAAYGYYFDADGIRYDFDFNGTRRNTTVSPTGDSKNTKNTGKSSETGKSDPYDVYEYDDPEEFYFDWREDFDGYEDAEEYWEDAW